MIIYLSTPPIITKPIHEAYKKLSAEIETTCSKPTLATSPLFVTALFPQHYKHEDIMKRMLRRNNVDMMLIVRVPNWEQSQFLEEELKLCQDNHILVDYYYPWQDALTKK